MAMNFTQRLMAQVCALLMLLGAANAGDRGKLVGIVRDASTKEPLVGADVTIIGTTLGAAADKNGFFLINNIPPGNYQVRYNLIGYQSVTVKDVRIRADVTTEQNAALQQITLQVSQEVVVIAERPLIQKDRTSTQTIVDGTTVARELRLTSVDAVLTLQAGVTKSPDGVLHVRGGRGGGLTYLIDGIPTVNPFDRSFAGILEIDRVEELQAHVGTFDAEFGNAADGIVSVVTRDGGEKYRVKVQYESARLNRSPYQQKDWNLTRDDVKNLPSDQQQLYLDEVRKPDGSSAYEFVSVLDDPFAKDYLIIKALGSLNASISGPIPFLPQLKFYMTGRFRNENGYMPYGYIMSRTATAKLSYPLTSTLNIRGAYDWSQSFRQLYDHQYKYWPWFNSGADVFGRTGSYPMDKGFTNRQMIQARHVLSARTFYDLSISRVYDYSTNAVPNRLVTFHDNTGGLIYSDYIKRLYVGGVEGNFRYGDVRFYTRVRSKQLIAKGNLESQFDNNNQMRAGFEVKSHEIFRHRIGMPPLANLQFFTQHPVDAAAYVQDKLEYRFMILKAGVRLDYFDAAASAYPDPGDILEVINLPGGSVDYRAVQKEPVKPRIQISPRIGIAHPISDRTSIHFAYGHFFQIPTFYNLYRNDALSDILVNDALIGNPGLKPEKTVSYELGIQHQFTDDWAINLTAYTKDITNLTSTFYYFVGRDYTMYVNADFGRVQGVDLTLDRRFSNHFSGRLTYSLTYAMGNMSDPAEGYNSYREDQAHLRPNRNFPLDFDQRHKINLILTAKVPKGFGPELLGTHPLEQFTVTAIYNAGSGLPYTPTSRAAEESRIIPEPNSARRAWNSNLDLKITRDFQIGDLELAAYVDIENAFDNLNVVSIWTRTGQPWNQGPTSVFSNDFQADPENMGPRRAFRVGMIAEF